MVMIVNSITPSVTFQGKKSNAPKVSHAHIAPRAATLALLGALATGCPAPEENRPEPPATVTPTAGAGGAQAGAAGSPGTGGVGGTGGVMTNPVINDSSPKNVYMGKLQAAKIIPADAVDYQGSSWYDEGEVINVNETVKSSTEESMVVKGDVKLQGGEGSYIHTFTVNPDGSVNLVRTVNGNVTEKYIITNQTRTINGKPIVFADFKCLQGGSDYSLSALGDGSGIVHQYADGNYTTPFNTLSGYKVKVDGKEPALVRNLKRVVDYDLNSKTTTKAENPVVVYAKGLFKDTKQRIVQELQPQTGFKRFRRLERFA